MQRNNQDIVGGVTLYEDSQSNFSLNYFSSTSVLKHRLLCFAQLPSSVMCGVHLECCTKVFGMFTVLCGSERRQQRARQAGGQREGDQLPQFAPNVPGFGTASPASWTTPQSQANWDHCSTYKEVEKRRHCLNTGVLSHSTP